MKKYKLWAIIIFIVLVGLIFLLLKVNNKVPEKSTKESVIELFSKKYNKSTNVTVVEVGLDSGSFARGSVNFTDELGGSAWFAVKTAKGWELVFDGNGIVPCDVAYNYNFPKDIIPQCIETKNNNELITR